jgi:hypothetical protein
VNIFDYIRSPWTPTPPYLPPKADSLPLAVGACDADEDAVAAPRLVVVRKPVASRAIGDVAVSSVRLREVVPVAAAAWAAVFEVVVGRVHACSRVVFLWLLVRVVCALVPPSRTIHSGQGMKKPLMQSL